MYTDQDLCITLCHSANALAWIWLLRSWQQDCNNPSHPLLAAIQAPSLPLVRLQKEIDDCNVMIKQDTCAINKGQEQLNQLQVKHRTLKLERQQLLDRRQHDVVACFLSMRISIEVGHIWVSEVLVLSS